MKIDKRFNELMTFAASEATTALSDLLHEPMQVEVIDISVAKQDIKKEMSQFYPKNGGTILMTTTLVGMVGGVATFILPTASAYKLCDVLLNRPTENLGEIEQSALLETGNIVIGCFLNALGYVSTINNILHKKLRLSIVERGQPHDVQFPKDSDDVLIRTSFHMRHANVAGAMETIDIDGLCVFFFKTAEVWARI
jgi:CheY-specific phosphatase CheX